MSFQKLLKDTRSVPHKIHKFAKSLKWRIRCYTGDPENLTGDLL